MNPLRFEILPPPAVLNNDVECFSIVRYSGHEALSIQVAPRAVPDLVFQHQNGHTAIDRIVTPSATMPSAPTLFFSAAVIEPSTMHFSGSPYTSIQVILKPDALPALLGINAAVMSRGFLSSDEFAGRSLNQQLMDADSPQACVALLSDFLVRQLRQEHQRDTLIQESLSLIHRDIACIRLRDLLEQLNISERHFERRFHQAVGVSPKTYIRVKRFNQAIRLIKTGRYPRLTDVAYALNFYDQSHLIRDITALSGITPKQVAQNDDAFYHDLSGYSYL